MADKEKIYPVPPPIEKQTFVTQDRYRQMYERSIQDPEGFWAEQAKQYITWNEPWQKVLSGGFDLLDVKWFQGGKLNACFNCIDRHLKDRGNQIALYWESDNPNISQKFTYNDLNDRICRLANVIKSYGIKKGDKVCIYLPMIPEVVIAMLACARIGAVHTVVFAGFSPESLKTRILDADCTLVITANEGLRGGHTIPLKLNVDRALKNCPRVKTVLVVKRTENPVPWDNTRDVWYHNAIASTPANCRPEMMAAEDPLFILYTSGSTGQPKGILQGTGGYMVYAAMTHKLVFDYHDKEIYWCTADVGWITGHTYGVYGPLANGATMVLFEGTPSFPSFARYWEIIDKYNVNIFYTAPTAIRALRREGNDWVRRTSRKSLRLLGTAGEPINPEAWDWYYRIVGSSRCPIVDTWWQTETGGIMLTPLPGATPLKPGSVAWPFFGVTAEIVDEKGNAVPDGTMGRLMITNPWPGIMQGIYKDPERFKDTYFKEVPGKYLTGDEGLRDTQGYFWISGRSDDVLKISGHRIGTQEVESALIKHPSVAEAAVIGAADPVKGNKVYAFVTLKLGFKSSDNMKKELIQRVRDTIGPIAAPDVIQWTESLPKTRSGKIMRRLLRKIANGDTKDLGDLSTLSDPDVVKTLIKETIQK